jgi:hypothetical protein
LTCQDDLIEFREAVENLRKGKGRVREQFKPPDKKFANDSDRS